jgi:hypothetical protein
MVPEGDAEEDYHSRPDARNTSLGLDCNCVAPERFLRAIFMISYSARCWAENSELSKRGRPDRQQISLVVVLICSGCGADDREDYEALWQQEGN